MPLRINSETANFNVELDRLAPDRPALACRWRRDADGRLACFRKPATDIAPNQQRMAAAAQTVAASPIERRAASKITVRLAPAPKDRSNELRIRH